MTRPTFTRIPGDDRGWQGLTRLDLGNGKSLAMIGTGKHVEAALLAERGKR